MPLVGPGLCSADEDLASVASSSGGVDVVGSFCVPKAWVALSILAPRQAQSLASWALEEWRRLFAVLVRHTEYEWLCEMLFNTETNSEEIQPTGRCK